MWKPEVNWQFKKVGFEMQETIFGMWEMGNKKLEVRLKKAHFSYPISHMPFWLKKIEFCPEKWEMGLKRGSSWLKCRPPLLLLKNERRLVLWAQLEAAWNCLTAVGQFFDLTSLIISFNTSLYHMHSQTICRDVLRVYFFKTPPLFLLFNSSNMSLVLWTFHACGRSLASLTRHAE